MSDHNELMKKFRAAAKKFVEDVDAAPQTETNAFLANVGRSMAELYSVALSLPAVDPETSSADEAPFQTDKFDELRRSLQRKMGSLDTYWQIFDSTQKEEPAQGSLSGDISDILHRTWKSRCDSNKTRHKAVEFSAPLGQTLEHQFCPIQETAGPDCSNRKGSRPEPTSEVRPLAGALGRLHRFSRNLH